MTRTQVGAQHAAPLQSPRYHRRSIRLKGYDYSQVGAYFVTICTWGRECVFGEIVNGEIRMNAWGDIVADCWQWLSEQYAYVGIDAWVVMPNHFHGIVVITDDVCRGGSRTAPTTTVIRKPLGRIIGAFKTVSTKRINRLRAAPGVPVWQRNYYERVIRDADEMNRIREYIATNPAHWAEDENNPSRVKKISPVGAQHAAPLQST